MEIAIVVLTISIMAGGGDTQRHAVTDEQGIELFSINESNGEYHLSSRGIDASVIVFITEIDNLYNLNLVDVHRLVVDKNRCEIENGMRERIICNTIFNNQFDEINNVRFRRLHDYDSEMFFITSEYVDGEWVSHTITDDQHGVVAFSDGRSGRLEAYDSLENHYLFISPPLALSALSEETRR